LKGLDGGVLKFLFSGQNSVGLVVRTFPISTSTGLMEDPHSFPTMPGTVKPLIFFDDPLNFLDYMPLKPMDFSYFQEGVLFLFVTIAVVGLQHNNNNNKIISLYYTAIHFLSTAVLARGDPQFES
jgi:hypothetical protein